MNKAPLRGNPKSGFLGPDALLIHFYTKEKQGKQPEPNSKMHLGSNLAGEEGPRIPGLAASLAEQAKGSRGYFLKTLKSSLTFLRLLQVFFRFRLAFHSNPGILNPLNPSESSLFNDSFFVLSLIDFNEPRNDP